MLLTNKPVGLRPCILRRPSVWVGCRRSARFVAVSKKPRAEMENFPGSDHARLVPLLFSEAPRGRAPRRAVMRWRRWGRMCHACVYLAISLQTVKCKVLGDWTLAGTFEARRRCGESHANVQSPVERSARLTCFCIPSAFLRIPPRCGCKVRVVYLRNRQRLHLHPNHPDSRVSVARFGWGHCATSLFLPVAVGSSRGCSMGCRREW